MDLSSPVEVLTDSGVLIITLNRGNEGNPLNPDSLTPLKESLEKGFSDPATRVLLLRSNTKTFCTGMDLQALTTSTGDVAALREAVGSYSGVLHAIYDSGKPVIASVAGEVRAGGVGLACACDIVCATPESSFSLSEALFGLVPANVLPYLLGYRITAQKARYLALTTRKLSGDEAYRLGIVDELAPPEDMEKLLKNRVRQIMRSSPEALRRIKALTAEMTGKDHEFSIRTAVESLLEVVSDPKVLGAIRDFREGMTPEWFSKYKPSRTLFQEENL